ncbi:MAG: DUF255 domain-containing protein [Prevotellaceae bacterium]|nr:DUF255 domain-containing protein [Prevotellaceae bacterium]
MKKFALVVLCVAFGTLAQAQMRWYNFEEAIELCKKQPKRIFIDVYTDWCGWCKVMDKNTFGHPDIAAYMNKDYYSVKLNAEMYDTVTFEDHKFVNEGGGRRSTHQLAASLLNGKMSYPSVVFMEYKDGKFQLLHVLPGYQTPEQFAPYMVYLGEGRYEKQSWEDFNKTFKWKNSQKQEVAATPAPAKKK